MKIIHSSDWHLGQRFFDRDRLEEQQLFLEHLLELVEREHVEALIVAGDIFDTANPPREAEKLYYDFLRRCSALGFCRIIITAGNHDSSSHLDAPKALLEAFNIHVIGALPDDLDEILIPLGSDSSNPEAWLAAVPFLRDRDVRRAVAGEQFEDMQARTQQGIIACYRRIAEEIEETIRAHTAVPIIATGHLSLIGAQASDSERTIHIGNLGSISASHFSSSFDYMALGHLHSPQAVGGDETIRYCGSPLPLSFGERTPKELRLIDIEGERLDQRAHELPSFRRLIRLRGNRDEIEAQLLTLGITKSELPPWIEVTLTQAGLGSSEQELLKELADRQGAAILKIGVELPTRERTEQPLSTKGLDEIQPREVFEYRLAEFESEVEKQDLLNCFNQILEEVQSSQ